MLGRGDGWILWTRSMITHYNYLYSMAHNFYLSVYRIRGQSLEGVRWESDWLPT
jgi:hypothetical protein